MPNVWLGTSVENWRFAFRADVLRQTPAAIIFVSAEPLLRPLAQTAFFFKQWGGQTSKASGRELDGRTWDELPESHPRVGAEGAFRLTA
ncbi:MAG: DUF5131 family protein [Solirubrobacteraceae bacterium]